MIYYDKTDLDCITYLISQLKAVECIVLVIEISRGIKHICRYKTKLCNFAIFVIKFSDRFSLNSVLSIKEKCMLPRVVTQFRRSMRKAIQACNVCKRYTLLSNCVHSQETRKWMRGFEGQV